MIAHTPQMPLMLQENFTVKLLEQLRLGEIDCAILAEPFPDTNLAIAPLYDGDRLWRRCPPHILWPAARTSRQMKSGRKPCCCWAMGTASATMCWSCAPIAVSPAHRWHAQEL